MTTYAIGDIQGCFHAFQALLTRIQFNPKLDQLWLVGDLINRGSGSLEVLRWCYAHQDSLKVVLGNHDLHALVVAGGFVRAHKGDTLDALLAADDGHGLLDWLRHQPLAYQDEPYPGEQYLMVHAGLLPQWTTEQVLSYAAEVEAALQGDNYLFFLANMYGNLPNTWSERLKGIERLRVITNAMTRLRVCTEQGAMDFDFKGELPDIPEGFIPWFDVPNRATLDTQVVFGHWSALGLQHRNNVYSLDTGCLWGGQLTALNLETKDIIQVQSHPLDKPIKIKRKT
ncbi:symmetrical bis(5'-nucleosyl)-tetraphosphatase [Methylotenera sp.]|uniref:symmetrical bis(5'-nucleosyl)-tetraphosphatase n=1 Tax=Methylotenera sp. TaxID=2051956 RepID=UPI002725D32D|nr:symmetrical bis(5'-nucleosyl)-tetraphosphatase [Methylotenera sp.]MDO9205720.1 symmetrical bis(5'-nucleosyl)-tetraphosphatase [Methylotenera sp.]MDP2070065.1 symmetrical bis(5'-nucleosyl)-tetraphosphatase [Methylotenera sp.]MDP2230011.1 symmetrical bis(5'-nucleosyl)-tetraphosphatase [Methylotenera sp.]MDP3006482.1 symmetrical bis(5'-nucleosyl)-tetraphosphatase [Methylotenera sp.]MDP3140574.1 symmetrical bis(5'-nucleosyl)-tetraphosphatase [Methylotenera sp.]